MTTRRCGFIGWDAGTSPVGLADSGGPGGEEQPLDLGLTFEVTIKPL